MRKNNPEEPKKGSIIIYKTPEGAAKLEVKLEKETVWLSQLQMSQLFQKDTRTISEHIANIFKESELKSKSVIRNFRKT